MQRYFAINKKLELNESDIHHIINVMRMKKNDKIEIIYDGITYLCNIDEIKNKKIIISIINEIVEDNELPVDVTIAQALVREAKFDYILQKATELGVKKIIPLITERTLIKVNQKENQKRQRWEKILKEAAEQSHRNLIPQITNITNINDLNSIEYDLKILCSVNEKNRNIKDILSKCKKCDKILVVIGPEGGFSINEEQKLINDGFITVSLGNRILRTETTPLFVLSAINYEVMR